VVSIKSTTANNCVGALKARFPLFFSFSWGQGGGGAIAPPVSLATLLPQNIAVDIVVQ